jgi:putative ABC transport system permease protein
MVTLGGGATAKVTEDIGKLGSNMLQLRPGQGFHGPGGARVSAEPFEVADAEALAREIANLEAVAPTASRSMQVIQGNENRSTTVIGTTDGFVLVRDWDLEAGRIFNPGELRGGKAVCVIGETVREACSAAWSPSEKPCASTASASRSSGCSPPKGRPASVRTRMTWCWFRCAPSSGASPVTPMSR